jgi:hypothetical protein
MRMPIRTGGKAQPSAEGTRSDMRMLARTVRVRIRFKAIFAFANAAGTARELGTRSVYSLNANPHASPSPKANAHRSPPPLLYYLSTTNKNYLV